MLLKVTQKRNDGSRCEKEGLELQHPEVVDIKVQHLVILICLE